MSQWFAGVGLYDRTLMRNRKEPCAEVASLVVGQSSSIGKTIKAGKFSLMLPKA